MHFGIDGVRHIDAAGGFFAARGGARERAARRAERSSALFEDTLMLRTTLTERAVYLDRSVGDP